MSRRRLPARPAILRLVSRRDDVERSYEFAPPALRLVFSDGEPSPDAAFETLPPGWGARALADFQRKCAECANAVADRAVEAMKAEVAAFGLELDPESWAAIRDPVLRAVAARMSARFVRAARGRDPVEDDLAGDPDDDLYPYVEHTGVGLRERLRAVLEPDDEPA